jgi:hypothetical protein
LAAYGAKRPFSEKLTPEMCQTPRDPHRLVSAPRWPLNVEIALSISDRAYIVDQGRIVYGGTARELLADNEIQEKYCSI